MEWDLCCNQNPSEKSKRAVVVLAVHNPPLPPSKNRKGASGIYVQDLKPLLVKAVFDYTPYDYKFSELFNQLGLFSKYFEELKEHEKVKRALERNGSEFDYNLWGDDRHLGKRKYNDIMSKKLKEVVTSALNSLQKEEAIEWSEHYVVMPNIYDKQYKLKDYLQFRADYKDCVRQLTLAAKRKNSVLNPELAHTLLFGNGGLPEYNQIKEICSLNFRPPASNAQTDAIENYQLYLRQCVYQQYCQSKDLPRESDLPDKWSFFANPQLSKLYNECRKTYAIQLLGGTSFWKQVRIVIVDDRKADRYYNPEAPTPTDLTASDRASANVLNYVEHQLSKPSIAPGKDDMEDISLIVGAAAPGRKYPLKSSKSAMALHTHLKELYNQG